VAPWPPADIDHTIDRLLELPQQIASRRKRQVVLVLDEFQEIITLDPELPARMVRVPIPI
jgi:hypothetical protein